MIQDYLDVFGDNVITHNRLEGVGPMNLEDCINYAVTGPAGRASGWKNDTRKRHPYDMYDKVCLLYTSMVERNTISFLWWFDGSNRLLLHKEW